MAAHLVDGATGLVKKPAIFMLKLFSATAVKQDEAILRRADRIETDRTEACSELRAHMMKSQVYCRQALAETKKVGLKLASGLVKLEEAVAESDIAKERFFELRKNQRAMEELEEHKLDWNRAIHDWMTEAHGVDPQIDTDNPDTLTLAQLLSDYMAKGEKAAPKHSTAVITYHPSAPISECLMVAYATEPAEDGVGFTTGQRLRHSVKKKTPVEEAVWAVLENGNPVRDAYLLLPLPQRQWRCSRRRVTGIATGEARAASAAASAPSPQHADTRLRYGTATALAPPLPHLRYSAIPTTIPR